MKTLNLRLILLTGLFLLTGTLTASAQEEQSRDKSVYLELLGPSMMVGTTMMHASRRVLHGAIVRGWALDIPSLTGSLAMLHQPAYTLFRWK